MITIFFWWVWFLILPHYVHNIIAYIIFLYYKYTYVLLRHIFVYTMIEFGMTYGTSKVSFETQSLFRFGAGGTESWADNRHVFAVVCHRFCLDPFGSIWWYENPDRHFLHNTVEASVYVHVYYVHNQVYIFSYNEMIQWYSMYYCIYMYILYLKLSYTLTQMLYESYVILAFIVVAIGSLCFGVPREGMPKRFMLRLFLLILRTCRRSWSPGCDRVLHRESFNNLRAEPWPVCDDKDGNCEKKNSPSACRPM